MKFDLNSEFLKFITNNFSERKLYLLEKVVTSIRDEFDGYDSIWLSGSFINSATFNDIDVLVIYPESYLKKNFIQIEIVDRTKVEIFHETISSILKRIYYELDVGHEGLLSLLNNSACVVGDSDYLKKFKSSLKEIKGNKKPISLTLSITYLYCALISLEKSNVNKGDVLSIVYDSLNILRQIYHEFYNEKTQGNLKHFLRKIAGDSRIGGLHFVDAIGNAICGDCSEYISMIMQWLRDNNLSYAESATLTGDAFEIIKKRDISEFF